MPTYDEAIGNALRRAREKAGLNQDQLSARVRRRHYHLVQAKLSRYENGRVPVPNRVVDLIERELRLAPGTIYLMAFNDEETLGDIMIRNGGVSIPATGGHSHPLTPHECRPWRFVTPPDEGEIVGAVARRHLEPAA